MLKTDLCFHQRFFFLQINIKYVCLLLFLSIRSLLSFLRIGCFLIFLNNSFASKNKNLYPQAAEISFDPTFISHLTIFQDFQYIGDFLERKLIFDYRLISLLFDSTQFLKMTRGIVSNEASPTKLFSKLSKELILHVEMQKGNNFSINEFFV